MHYTSIDLKSVILFDGLFIQTQENISNFTLQEKDSKNQINPKSNNRTYFGLTINVARP